MRIKRIIPEFNSSDLDATRDFYCGMLGLGVDMEEGTFLLSSEAAPNAQLVVNDSARDYYRPYGRKLKNAVFISEQRPAWLMLSRRIVKWEQPDEIRKIQR